MKKNSTCKLSQLKNVSFIVLLLSFMLLTACEDSTGCLDGDCGNSDGDIEITIDGDTEENVDGDIDSELEDENLAIADGAFDGAWAMRFAISYTTVLPILECKVQMLLSGVAKLQATQDGTSLKFTEEICDMSMDLVEDIYFFVIFTDDVIAATGTPQRSSEFSALETGADWLTSPAWDLYGVDGSQMDDPNNDPLPENADDPLVIDFDNDGKPGLTTPIRGFVGDNSEVYVVMRMMRNMIGTVINENLITGKIESSVEMITLGADPEMFAFDMDLKKHDDPNVNYFEMVKLDNDLSCSDIFSKKDELFTYVPMDHATPLWTDKCPKEQ